MRIRPLIAPIAVLCFLAVQARAAVPFEVTEVAPGIFVRQGIHEDATEANADGIANIGFVVGHDAVAVIDPGGSRIDGDRLRATIAGKTTKPIRFVVMTHGHPDHIFGGSAFAADHPVFVGHARLPGELAARGAYYRDELAKLLGAEAAGDYVVPSLLVEDKSEIDLGGRRLELMAEPTAHTDNDLAIYDPETKTLWAGDLLFVDRVPSLDGSLSGWLKLLKTLEAMPAVRAVPGHGPPSVPWPAGAADEERYLGTLDREIRALLAKNGDIETAVRTVGLDERDKWQLFDDYNGHNVTVAFKELEWEE